MSKLPIPLYIFDLDGTLADLKHRRPHVERPSLKCYDCGGKNRKACPVCFDLDVGWKPNWDAFHAACVDDKPILPTLYTLMALANAGNEIWIWSGRKDTVELETRVWLSNHLPDNTFTQLRMRPADNNIADNTLKEFWVLQMAKADRDRLVMVFDDRNRVVDMWRSHGIVCAQVAPGDF